MRTTLKPLGRGPYIALGLSLFVVKLLIDSALAKAFGRPFSPLLYVSPIDAPLFRPSEGLGYWVAMCGVAVPFLAVGVLLTARRLKDATLSPWLNVLFFVPFANLLFFVAAASAPTRAVVPPRPASEQPLYRQGQPERAPALPPRNPTTSIWLAGMLGAVIGLGAVGVSVGLMRSYGAALMLGAPVISGFATSTFFVRFHPDKPYWSGAALATCVSFALSFGVIIGFALEGLGCLVMALPLIVPVVFFGSFIGYALAREGAARGMAPRALRS